MTLYRWDSVERKFTPTSVHSDVAPGERVHRQFRVGKGERIRAEVATGELIIRVLEGAVANADRKRPVYCAPQ